MLRNALKNASRAIKRASASGAAGAVLAGGRQVLSTAAKTAGGNYKEGSAAVLAAVFAATSTSSVAFASNKERSFIMVKPDGVNRGLVHEIIGVFERKGYKLVGAKVLVPSKEVAALHYNEHEGKPFFPKLVNFLSSGPVVALVFEGKGVVSYGRTLLGATNPLASAPGTIRGNYGIDVGRNICHASDSVDSSQREIALWFKAEELADYSRLIDEWIYE